VPRLDGSVLWTLPHTPDGLRIRLGELRQPALDYKFYLQGRGTTHEAVSKRLAISPDTLSTFGNGNGNGNGKHFPSLRAGTAAARAASPTSPWQGWSTARGCTRSERCSPP
jgi:hypothetical protein